VNASEWITNLANPRTIFDHNRIANERTPLGFKLPNCVVDVCDRPIGDLPGRLLPGLSVRFMKAEERFSALKSHKSRPVDRWRETEEPTIPRGDLINVRDEKHDRMN
jgi:hypothetical protein